MANKIYSSKEGYNIIAPFYDTWKWQIFWHENEYPFIEKWCNTLNIGKGIDLGTGSGNNLQCFLSKGHHINAIDISEKMIALCKKKYPNNPLLDCTVMDIHQLPTFEREYDWILSNRVFAHIKDIGLIIKILSRIIKFGGQCFISDLHPLHNYQYTNYTIENGEEVCIETYKHSINSIEALFAENNFDIIKYKSFTKTDLINQDLKDFPKLQLQDTPIFYYYIVKYKGNNSMQKT